MNTSATGAQGLEGSLPEGPRRSSMTLLPSLKDLRRRLDLIRSISASATGAISENGRQYLMGAAEALAFSLGEPNRLNAQLGAMEQTIAVIRHEPTIEAVSDIEVIKPARPTRMEE